MPLSEEELRLLEQMERELAAEDPKFVATLRGGTLRRSVRLRTAAAAVVFVLGVTLMMSGAVAQRTWLGVAGFLIMLASATLGLAAWRGHRAPRESGGPTPFARREHGPFEVIDGGRRARRPRPSQKPRHGTFMQRLEQRWQDRRNQGF